MRSTIDKAGRLVVPKVLRDWLGLRPVAVEISGDGAALRIGVLTERGLERRSGRLLIPATGMKLDDSAARALADADREVGG
jgi:bifunctional DNA-binding transcriptional regulator/antitoxin component of YhaV-PrlF toxin-antitoxin module